MFLQFISDDMNLVSQCLLAKLKMLQQADPVQGMWSKRFFCSIKEVGPGTKAPGSGMLVVPCLPATLPMPAPDKPRLHNLPPTGPACARGG